MSCVGSYVFSCKEPCELCHKCLGKWKEHYEEVVDPSLESEHQWWQIATGDMVHGTTATLPGVPKYHPFRVRGVLKGQQVTCLVDRKTTHNFIDEGLVVKRVLQLEDFQGFSVMVANGFKISCTKKISQLSIQLGDYIVSDNFYVIGIGEVDVLLGVQWLHSLGIYIQNFQKMELEFMADGTKIVLRALVDDVPVLLE